MGLELFLLQSFKRNSGDGMILASCMSISLILGCLIFNLFPVNAPGKALEADPILWTPAQMGDPDGVVHLWLQLQ